MKKIRRKRKASKKAGPIDWTLMITAFMLVFIGLIMVYSSSWPEAMKKNLKPNYFLKRQIMFSILGTGLIFFLMNVNYKTWRKYSKLLFIISLAIVPLVFLSAERQGGQRWINLGLFSFMPGDVIKVTSVLYFSRFLVENQKTIKNFKNGTWKGLKIIGIVALFIIIQKDLGTTIIIVGTLFAMFFVAGLKLSHLIPFAAGGSVGLYFLYHKALNSPGTGLHNRLRRIISFRDPFEYKLGDGWQAVNSLHALGSGGLFGVGLGKSRQKFFYIPEPYNDFIFSIIGEELGLVGTVFVIALYMVLIWRGVLIAIKSKDRYGSLVAAGLTALIAIQSLVHIGVVTSSIPTTGVTIPFISYGGTSLVIFMSTIGILLNISRYTELN